MSNPMTWFDLSIYISEKHPTLLWACGDHANFDGMMPSRELVEMTCLYDDPGPGYEDGTPSVPILYVLSDNTIRENESWQVVAVGMGDLRNFRDVKQYARECEIHGFDWKQEVREIRGRFTASGT